MTELKIHPEMSPANKKEIKKLFDAGLKEFGRLLAKENDIPLGGVVEIDWACAWNRPEEVGKRAIVIATDGKFCMIEMPLESSTPIMFYRAEDLKFLGKIAKIEKT